MRSVVFAACLLVFAFTAVCRAQDDSAAINQTLDKVTNLEVNGVMPKVMVQITQETGVPIDVPQRVYDLLPFGQQTNIKATIKNQTLRQALTAVTRRLGLNWELQQQGVKLIARPPLDRITRRATLAELETLDLLDSTPFDAVPAAGQPTTVGWVIDSINQKLSVLKSPVVINYRPGDKIKPDQQINLPRNLTLSDALKELVKQTDLSWYPWEQHIIVLSKEEQIGRQLDRTVTKHFVGEELHLVLNELAQAAGVEFEFEAGALQRVPAEFRRITLTLDNARVRVALDDIRGVTGLDFVVKPAGVYLWNQNPPTATAAAMPAPIVASLQLDNGMILFLRANEVPPDILEYAEHKKLKEFKRLREQMKDEQFVPKAQPTSRPAQ